MVNLNWKGKTEIKKEIEREQYKDLKLRHKK